MGGMTDNAKVLLTQQRIRVRPLVFVVLAGAGVLWVADGVWTPLHPAKLGRWLYTWFDGFTGRAFAGTVLRSVVGVVTERHITVVAIAAALLLVVVVAWVLSRWVVEDGQLVTERALLAAAFLLGAVGWGAVVQHIGRFDHIVLLLGVAAGYSVTRRWYVAASLLLAVAVLVHEVAFVFVAIWVVVLARRAWIAIPPLAALGAVMLLRPEHAVFANPGGVPIHPFTLEYQLWGFSDSLTFSVDRLLSWSGMFQLAGTVAAVLPLAVMCFLLVRDRIERHDYMLYAAAAAPMAVSIVGTDYGRWFMFAAWLMVATTFLILRREPRPATLETWLSAGVVVAAGIVSGPMMVYGFEWLVR